MVVIAVPIQRIMGVRMMVTVIVMGRVMRAMV